MKKVLIIVVALLTTFTLASCTNKNVKLIDKAIEQVKKEIPETLYQGDKITLPLEVKVDNDGKEVVVTASWTSSDVALVAIDEKGALTISEATAKKDITLTGTFKLEKASKTQKFQTAVDKISIKYLNAALDRQEVPKNISRATVLLLPKDVVINYNDLNKEITFKWSSNSTDFKLDAEGDDSVYLYDILFKETESYDVILKVTATVDGDSQSIDFPATILAKNAKSTFEELYNQLVAGDFANAPAEKRLELLGVLEKYLLDQQATIPIYSNSGYTIFNDRVKLPSQTHIPVMGFGLSYADVEPIDGKKILRSWTGSIAENINQLNSADTSQSDITTKILGTLFDFKFNDDFSGYKLTNSMAKTLAPLDANYDPALGSKTWKITLREDLLWHAGTYSNGVGIIEGTAAQKITAKDYIYSFKQLLDSRYEFSRANYLYNADFPIVKAERYAKGIGNWEDVGIKAVEGDPLSFTMELTRPLKEWTFMYSMSSDIFSPVYEPLFEKLAVKTGDNWTNGYGGSIDKIVANGPYALTKWDKGAGGNGGSLIYKKVNSFFGAADYKIEEITVTQAKDATAALLLFESGAIDYSTIPAQRYDEFKEKPLKFTPGSTVWRLGINYLSEENSVKGWHKPILTQLEFREALYLAMDREAIAKDVTKTGTATQGYFSTSHYYDPINLLAYPDSEPAKANLANLAPETMGYSKEAAQAKFEVALKKLVDAGKVKTDEKIVLEIALFDGSTMETLGNYLQTHLNGIFVSKVYPNIKVTFQAKYFPGFDVYYKKQMTKEYDISIQGISGSSLDPFGLLEIFLSNNQSGLFLLHGLDTTVRDIDFDLSLE